MESVNEKLSAILDSIEQKELFYSLSDSQKINLVADIMRLDLTYKGGLPQYMRNTKQLLNPSLQSQKKQVVIPEIPSGLDIALESDDFEPLDHLGKQQLKYCCFAIVGGGIGERLNSSIAKLCLTSSLVTGFTFLQFYFSYFMAIQNEFHCIVPVAIMTSEKTHDQILKILEENLYFGLKREYVTLMKQLVVPTVLDKDCHLALHEDGHMIMKPHGHGDIHRLLWSNDLPAIWKRMGKRHIVFLQDTNILATYGCSLLLGAAVTQSLHFGSLGIVRKPGEKVGSICNLVYGDGKRLTCNVEYNEFESFLLQATGKGDMPNANGNSDYPGNINILYVELSSYVDSLCTSHGCVPEFINPKYSADNRSFTSPARLECMMQDYPRTMHSTSNIGYCSLPRWMCFSAVKNSIENGQQQEKQTGYGETFHSMEEDYYRLFRRIIRLSYPDLGDGTKDKTIAKSCGTPSTPVLLFTPQAALTCSDIKNRIFGSFSMSDRSLLYIDGRNVTLENVVIDGSVVIRACQGAHVHISNQHFCNKGWRWVESKEDTMRGYELLKEETTEFIFMEAGYYYI